MKQLQVTIAKKQQDYTIVIGQNILENISEYVDLSKYSQIFVITDENVAPLFLDKLLANLPENTAKIILPAGEETKNIEIAQKIWSAMKDAKLDRGSLVMNLGGGVIGDLGGFVAATYMRGTHFINIPTTLLAQIDESVGGKTMVNFADIKNFIGVFYQPSAVIIDTQTLATLPQRQLLSGFAEIIKHGLIADKEYFEKVTSKKPEEFSQEELIDIIAKSCEIKKSFVEKDPEETTGIRKVVNFGHTVGHALESLSFETDKPLLHGEAVSIGMVAEAKISQLQNMLSEDELKTIEKALVAANLPTSLRDHEVAKQSLTQIINKMQSDKKNENGKINFTLLSAIGQAVYNQDTIPPEIIEQAITHINQ